ncbi:MAG TPA: hypothetical protein VH597_15955 [Verrucomicrobiae bacterium]|jgi:hypothetical protein|nr:hypothetical protein [Verrucomicrobiae bacterium]
MSELTSDALEYLRSTHAEGCRILREADYRAESLEIAIKVERHRWYWKPKQPKLVLVAESHVFTSDQDASFKISEAQIRPFLRRNANLPPEHFVRLVYCLAYGESNLLTIKPAKLSNAGTPTYWDMFGRITFRSPQPRQEDGASFDDRLRWKIDTLRELYRMGIWLLDGSVHAIYRRKEGRVDIEVQKELHEQWWKGYGGFLLKSCGSSKVWIIGKTVHDCLNESKFNDRSYRGWVYQPNASGVDLNRNWRRLLEDCYLLRKRSKN